MTYVTARAWAEYFPPRVVDNDELSSLMETSDKWIQTHTGIKTRHIAIDENTSEMATKVGEKLLAQSKLRAAQIDMIIVSTISPDALTPSTAALVQANLGATTAFAYDISAACAGFVFALSTAEKFIRSGAYHNVMVISAENNSKMQDFKDRTSAVFFADGAAGMIISSTPEKEKEIFVAEKLCTAGNADVIHSGRIAPLKEISAANYPKVDAFYQDGHAVFNFVTETVTKHIADFLQKQKISPQQLDLVVPHQANLRLIEKIAAYLDLPTDRFGVNITDHGNTSSVGIPSVLTEELNDRDQVGLVLLSGFGAGLAYGSLLLNFSGCDLNQ
ncbi:beta-ketoacyl-ACP synthase III [Ligilactobacillus acidipiscis]|uniref:3-oxoacyl-[acyl-carrier-protein] synthase, KASIII n=1 Tax=Ligilactobacillus acidipiscis TaxID=89059 RepID=A0A1K1KQG2_9LACO|nr:beta-ketoacyl-ACP synthase III [Ligilactobacillus acidipiscis]SFV41136.1 3-oxoacyl-[acyl-carrier-protein] synthase, KASIII [Ligilactobacillus acidipiscis]